MWQIIYTKEDSVWAFIPMLPVILVEVYVEVMGMKISMPGISRLLPEAAHLHQIDQALHILLHLLQAARPVQFGRQLLQSGL